MQVPLHILITGLVRVPVALLTDIVVWEPVAVNEYQTSRGVLLILIGQVLRYGYGADGVALTLV